MWQFLSLIWGAKEYGNVWLVSDFVLKQTKWVLSL